VRVLLVRHPEPIGATGLCYGRTDLDVTPESVTRLADRVHEILGTSVILPTETPVFLPKAGSPDDDGSLVGDAEPRSAVPQLAVLSSPLKRCTSLAQALGTYECDPRLLELDFGSWEGVSWDDIDRTDFDRWAADYVHNRVPGGESWSDVRDRVDSFLADMRKRPDSTAVVVTHAGVIRPVLSLVLGFPLESTWSIDIPFGCIAELDLTAESGKLVSLTP